MTDSWIILWMENKWDSWLVINDSWKRWRSSPWVDQPTKRILRTVRPISAGRDFGEDMAFAWAMNFIERLDVEMMESLNGIVDNLDNLDNLDIWFGCVWKYTLSDVCVCRDYFDDSTVDSPFSAKLSDLKSYGEYGIPNTTNHPEWPWNRFEKNKNFRFMALGLPHYMFLQILSMALSIYFVVFVLIYLFIYVLIYLYIYLFFDLYIHKHTSSSMKCRHTTVAWFVGYNFIYALRYVPKWKMDRQVMTGWWFGKCFIVP